MYDISDVGSFNQLLSYKCLISPKSLMSEVQNGSSMRKKDIGDVAPWCRSVSSHKKKDVRHLRCQYNPSKYCFCKCM